MSWIAKGLLMYLFLAMAFSFAYPEAVFCTQSSPIACENGKPLATTPLTWFDMSYNQNTGNITLSGVGDSAYNSTHSLSVVQKGGSVGTVLLIFEPIGQILQWFALIFAVIISPITIFTSPIMAGAPIAITFLFAIPLVFIVMVGLVFWIRGVG